jgi:chromate reductase, NAD(P)H dehydrogenase (quinone)
MKDKKNILVIVGSASSNSSNLQLAKKLIELGEEYFNFTIFNELKLLPHFDPEYSLENTPQEILQFRNNIEEADGVIFSTPEYIFSLPSGLKNAIEWCIATTIFSEKPIGIITASASGEKAHESLQFIMKTAMAKFSLETTLLLKGIKGKLDNKGNLIDADSTEKLVSFLHSFNEMIYM